MNFRAGGIYIPLPFCPSGRPEPFAVFNLRRFFCFFSLSEGGAMYFQSLRWNIELGMVRSFDKLRTGLCSPRVVDCEVRLAAGTERGNSLGGFCLDEI
jgi:hypothetical protein